MERERERENRNAISLHPSGSMIKDARKAMDCEDRVIGWGGGGAGRRALNEDEQPSSTLCRG